MRIQNSSLLQKKRLMKQEGGRDSARTTTPRFCILVFLIRFLPVDHSRPIDIHESSPTSTPMIPSLTRSIRFLCCPCYTLGLQYLHNSHTSNTSPSIINQVHAFLESTPFNPTQLALKADSHVLLTSNLRDRHSWLGDHDVIFMLT